MIGEGLINAFTAFVKFVLGLFPDGAPPAWMSQGTAALSTVWSYAAGLGAWVPWSFAGTVIGAIVASVGIGFAIKIVRIVASFFTAGGGSAA